MAQADIAKQNSPIPNDVDPAETAEWLESLDYVLERKGPERVQQLLTALEQAAIRNGVELPFQATTPYVNTIPHEKQPRYPGKRELERRIKSFVRWNAMAMVVRANRKVDGIGGHISTYASSANLYEVAMNHFFRGRGESGYDGDQIYFQGHASPGMYSRAFLEGRLTEENLTNFRRELQSGGGLSSYPHPWLMPDFWEFPTVSMGLGPIMAIYQARFNRYMTDRGIADLSKKHVWAFLGDGECDEPESLGAITLASREKLDNLIFVINCNLQRLDGPVRGNGKIIQELEGAFRGAGWNVIKVVWGSDWDPLLDLDETGLLQQRMMEIPDGQYQKYVVSSGDYIREDFFGKYPEVAEMVKTYSDEKLQKMKRGGHDPEKVYAAYKAAIDCEGKPTVILAKTIKGYGLGEGGEGRNVTHNQKKMNEDELREFRTRFGIPISDERVADAPFYRPPEDSPEMNYLRERRKALGGSVPSRSITPVTMEVPRLADYEKTLGKMASGPGKEMSTTMGYVRLLGDLLRDKKIGKNIVPIVPDESRTFGMEGLFRQVGIYSHVGQLYDPVDSDQLAFYKEAKDGQLFEEGITEAGSMSSFVAAGTAYSSHGVNMIPMFIYYSMFGFQRIGDLIWAAADARAKGFILGGTFGRTTLNGEGLQHQDGHSLLNAIAFPTVRAYDPAYAYETAVIIFDGLKRLYEDNETAMYYITLQNENYEMPEMPAGCEEGIIRGMYKVSSVDVEGSQNRATLFGSGAILRQALKAQTILAEKYQIASDVWSVTSYTELRREAQECKRWNLLHPMQPPRVPYVERALEAIDGPCVASSDNVRALPEQISEWVPGGMYVLGTDGMGRSESRGALRRHFEVDAECITVATLYQLKEQGKCDGQCVANAIKDLGIDPPKRNRPFTRKEQEFFSFFREGNLDMPTQIKLPNLGENIESGDVLTIFVSEGDVVKANQDLLEVETDKATMPVPAPQAGKITKVLVKEGDTIEVGAAIMEFEASGAEAKASKPKTDEPKEEKANAPKPKAPEPQDEDEESAEEEQEEEAPKPKAPPKKSQLRKPEPEEDEDDEPAPAPVKAKAKKSSPPSETEDDESGDGHVIAAAGPAVRRLARQLGVDLRRVRPTGAAGRVTVEDVRAHIRETNEQVAASSPRGITPPGSPDTDDFGGVRLEKMSRMRQTIARNMVESYTTIPQLTNFDDADVTELEDMRAQSKRDYADRGIKLTGMSFVIKAIASSLKRHPMLNASVDMESNTIIYKEYVNIGIAVDTDRGLVVPVLRDADRKSISQIASEIEELAGTVRDGKFDLEMLKGGTFTVSNLGSVGGTYSTPIINPPQVAILLVGRSRIVPHIHAEKLVARLMMPLSISYDHRLVDGAAAARFTNEVKSYLEAPGRLLLAP